MTTTIAPATAPTTPAAPAARGPVIQAPLVAQDIIRGGILDAASSVVYGDGPWMLGGTMAEFDTCTVAHTGDSPCEPQDLVLDAPGGWSEAAPFSVYAMYECRTVGVDQQAIAKRAEAALERSQGAAIEHAFLERVLAPTAAIINPDDTYNPAEGIAILEGWLAAHYGGVGVLHLPRSVVSLVGGTQRFVFDGLNGEKITTLLGTRVAAGGGYEDQQDAAGNALTPAGGTTADGDETWLYATGSVQVNLSDTHTSDVVYELAHNEFVVLAQRMAAVLADCVCVAVKVSACAF